jgi:predicted transcriptional regulator
MKHEPPIFEDIDEAAEASADARAEEDIRAGRVISHEAVSQWLDSWGSAQPLPRPKCGE